MPRLRIVERHAGPGVVEIAQITCCPRLALVGGAPIPSGRPQVVLLNPATEIIDIAHGELGRREAGVGGRTQYLDRARIVGEQTVADLALQHIAEQLPGQRAVALDRFLQQRHRLVDPAVGQQRPRQPRLVLHERRSGRDGFLAGGDGERDIDLAEIVPEHRVARLVL